MFSEITLPIPPRVGTIQRYPVLNGAATSLLIAQWLQQQERVVLLVVTDSASARQLQAELPYFTTIPIIWFPDWETLPYDNFSPDAEILSQRLALLYQLPLLTRGCVIVPLHTLMQRLSPRHFLTRHALWLKAGQTLARDALCQQLDQAGYSQVDVVAFPGEFAVRGSLLDLFPMGCQHPYRLDFFGNELESIRSFDVDNQRSNPQPIPQLQLLPAREFGSDSASIECFRRQWRQQLTIERETDHLYQQVSRGIYPPGVDYWLALFFEEPLETLFDYLPANSLLITLGNDLADSAKQFRKTVLQRYESRRYDPLRPLLSPDALWLTVEQLFTAWKRYPRLQLQPTTAAHTESPWPLQPLPPLSLATGSNSTFTALQLFIQQFTGTLLFSVESAGRREVLIELLRPLNLCLQPIQQFSEATTAGPYVLITPCQQGFMVADGYALITESDLLGQRVAAVTSTGRKKTVTVDNWIRHLVELTPGQPVVHQQHGIGRYRGLTTLEIQEVAAEYLELQYADEAVLYVPVTSLNLISRYQGVSEAQAPLHKLGSDHWNQARQKALEKAHDVAAGLLEIYTQRAAKPGFAFTLHSQEYQRFCQAFPFEETPDQAAAIQAVLQDMQQSQPMDRLICGDVGFGKTEVALRAAFIALSNHKQVLLLVPTTLLAEQHAETFRDRFASWPVRVDVLSRFRSTKAQQQILEQYQQGSLDLLIGTHKLLQRTLIPKDLGLLIIDEEHRFGVQQKEQIKAHRAHIDLLSLTATPIPRTLNLALHGLRDLSIIATPPTRRLAVKTFVRESDPLLIREALQREILRGGQAYYLYNEVKTIEQIAEKLRQLVPEARIGIGHGQMNERSLERIMSDFYHQRFNILLCSSIIETGIDIPSANTIIIERADRFGLAQLHQLRGRVGRSHHQAYAYLLIPAQQRLTPEASQRLEAIESLDELGAGFALATHDLDIRGAGELLGAEQSGQVSAVGFTHYQELLETAVKALKKGEQPSLMQLLQQQTEIDCRLPALLPENYIPNVNLRLSFYKQLASAADPITVQALQEELNDRFGPLPEAAKTLLEITQLRQLAQPLGIQRLEAHATGGTVLFFEKTPVEPERVIALIQSEPQIFRLTASNRLQFKKALPIPKERLLFIQTLLTRLQG
ncbi:MAG: transcription-repair coupling factor [Candidatus Symbiodolus clandestinus]